MNKTILFVIIFSILLIKFSFATTITLNESNSGNVGDAWANNNNPTWNYGKDIYLMVQGSGGTAKERSYIQFNLSVIPAGATITNANYSLFESTQVSNPAIFIAVYNTSPMNTTGTAYWNEGTLSGVDCGTRCNLDQNITWNNQPATGTLQDNQTSLTAGLVRMYWNVTNAAITAYANTTYQRLSLVAEKSPENSIGGGLNRFYSSNYTIVANRPQLVITYTIATPPTYSGNQTNTTWNGVPANFSLNWNSNVGLNGYIFSTNNSGIWTNSSFITFTGLSNVSWIVTTLNSTIGSLVQWKFYANDTSNNWSTSSIYNLTVTSYPYLQISNVGENVSTIAPNGTVKLYAQGMDTYSLDWAILSTNESGSWQNKSWYAPLNLNNYTTWYGNNTMDNSVYIEDLNGDGKPEILTLGNYYNFTDDNTYAQLKIWSYTAASATSGSLNILAEKDWTSGGEAYGYSVVVDDLSHDGHKKIITVGVVGGTWNSGDLRIWNYTDGKINLETVKNWYMVNVTNTTSAWSVTTGDINGDGHDEIVTSGMFNESWPQPGYISQLRVWNYTSNVINLISSNEWYTGGRTEAQSVRVGDLTGDGTKKIIVGGLSTGGARYQAEISIFNLTNNVLMLENRTNWHGLNDTIVYSVAIGDVNNDGVPELVTGGLEKNDAVRRSAQLRIWTYTNKQLNLKDDEVWYVPNGGDSEIYSVVINDINKDGILEIVTAGLSNNEYGPGNIDRGQVRIWTFVNNVMSLKKENLWSDGIGVLEGELDDSLKVADLNNDGINEIITGGRTEGNPNLGILRVYSAGNIYGSPMNLTKIANTWLWSNFTWSNSSVPNNTVVGWRIYFNDTYGNVNATDIMTFTVGGPNVGNSTSPTFSNCFQNVANNTAVNAGSTISVGCKWNDNVGLNMFVNSTKINNSGSFSNGTWQTFSAGNWSNFTFAFPNEQGSNLTMKIYANDTSNNQNVTRIWFWYNISVPLDNTSPTYSLNSTNSTTAGTPIQFNLYWTDGVALSKSITSLWNGSDWVNASSWCTLSGTTGWCNQTIVVNSTPQQLWWKQYANDTSNNWNTSQNFSLITTDTTPPTVIILSPNNTTYSNATIALNFTTVDIGSGVDLTKCVYKIDVGIMTSIPSCANITLSAMTNGSHTVIVYSNDTAGNQGSASVSFTVNTTTPVTTGHLIVNKVTNPSNNTTALFSITASGTGSVTVPANATVTGNSSHNYEVTSGTYNVTENSVSGWNQTSNNCTNVVVAVGQNVNCTIINTQILTAPNISIVSPADGSLVTQNSILLNVSTDENAVCKYDSNDVSYDLMSNMFNSTNSTLHTSYLSNFQDGIYVLYIRCKDDYGNVNQVSKKTSFIINAHLTALTITSVNTVTYQTSKNVILNITTNNNSYCRYSNQGVGYDYMSNQFTNGEGSTLHWTSVDSQEGVNIFYASCSDTSGSSMTTATPILFSVDTSSNYNITIPLKQWWNSFLLSRMILEKIDSLKGNYTVTNVLSSIADNYQILYYYNGTSWTSYDSGRQVNDLNEFNDQSNLPYWIDMFVADRIEIQ